MSQTLASAAAKTDSVISHLAEDESQEADLPQFRIEEGESSLIKGGSDR